MIGEHGRGGLGRVLRAKDRYLRRDIAIKELLHRDVTSEARFAREALITANLEHPGIVPVHEAGRWPDGTPFYAMKLVAGRPLRDLILERDSVAKRITLLHHVIAVADAIAYAHQRNIIHRDLKPANIIVGEFGETIVIDWGLAKNLAESDDERRKSPESVGQDVEASNDLTKAGAVLGTPVYMAPEQERGEPVDPRADVFAIGAMLWELCSLQRVPPSSPRQRAGLLRTGGIDQDLGAIINKCLELDRKQRYSDAGELAADLKAFKSGARVAARRYSVTNVFTHWLRRHRAVAVSVAALIALAATSAAIYVRSIAIERDRAQQASNAVMLENAALLLHTDPTSALTALSGYRGAETQRAARIKAEARGRGVARALNVHSDTVHLAAGTATGEIISVSEDRRVRLTRTNGAIETIADDVATPIAAAFSDAQQLLAYSSVSSGVVILQLDTRASKHITTNPPFALRFSPDGTWLATIDKTSQIAIFATQGSLSPILELSIEGAWDIVVADSDHIVVPTETDIRLIAIRDASQRRIPVTLSALTANTEWVAGGDDTGSLHIYHWDMPHSQRSLRVCQESINEVQLIQTKNLLAFACKDGIASIVEVPSLALRNKIPIQGKPTQIRASHDGAHVIIADDATTIYVYDTANRTTSRYDGHAARIWSVSAPSARYTSIVSGDIQGTIREWGRPESPSRLVAHVDASILHARITSDSSHIIFSSNNGFIFSTRISDGLTAKHQAHIGPIEGIRFTPNGNYVVSNSFDGMAHVWNAQDLSLVRSQDGHRARVGDIDFLHNDIISAGDDGRILRWRASDDRTSTLLETDQPLLFIETMADSSLAATDASGRTWHIKADGTALQIRSANGDAVTVLRASKSHNILTIGTERGRVTIFRESAWNPTNAFDVSGALRQIAISPDGNYLALATKTKQVYLFALQSHITPRWAHTLLDASDLSFSPDGNVLAFVCRDGSLWFYTFDKNQWIFTREHYAGTTSGRFSLNGKWFVSGAADGTVVLRDIRDTLQSASTTQE